MMQFNKAIKDVWETDVLVVGSGSAGATAAIATAQAGMPVTLVERYGFMGGTSTQVLDTFYGFYTPGKVTKKVIGGGPAQGVGALFARKKAQLRPNNYPAGQGRTYDPPKPTRILENL